jgi:hypothetical protein
MACKLQSFSQSLMQIFTKIAKVVKLIIYRSLNILLQKLHANCKASHYHFSKHIGHRQLDRQTQKDRRTDTQAGKMGVYDIDRV